MTRLLLPALLTDAGPRLTGPGRPEELTADHAASAESSKRRDGRGRTESGLLHLSPAVVLCVLCALCGSIPPRARILQARRTP